MGKLTTRRGMLGSLGALLGGGAVGALVVRETSESAATTSVRRVLRSSDLRFTRPGTTAGELAASGTSALPSGTLEDESGAYAGLLSSTLVAGSAGPDLLHRLELLDGTLLGVGPAGVEETGFSVVSGTGRYLGATGTYTARQAPRAAELVLDLTLPEA
jgi:hypothetical protein